MNQMDRQNPTPRRPRLIPERVRIPIGEREALTVECLRPDAAAPQRQEIPPAPPASPPGPAPSPPRSPAPEPPAPAAILPAHPVLLAVVEAVPAGGEEFVSAAAAAWAAAGRRVAVVSLDKQNRLAARFGRPPVPSWVWSQAAPELFQPEGALLLVPGPSAEAEVSPEAADRVVSTLLSTAEVCLVDLGCRWEPRLFRSVLFHATHIIVLTRSGQWSGAEMRLEQAELSGWTDMRKLRLVVVGAALPPPGMLGSAVAALLPEPGGGEAQAFVMREVGRSQR